MITLLMLGDHTSRATMQTADPRSGNASCTATRALLSFSFRSFSRCRCTCKPYRHKPLRNLRAFLLKMRDWVPARSRLEDERGGFIYSRNKQPIMTAMKRTILSPRVSGASRPPRVNSSPPLAIDMLAVALIARNVKPNGCFLDVYFYSPIAFERYTINALSCHYLLLSKEMMMTAVDS